ncbi:hypothetical protein [Lignipirellula cremea]|uniref:Uncharacterized protein n=1 Tax=Lignipirellula cremea TaxID=2528010 RepID=A0A518DRR4_9BACT|nr:hypothetical protein [Lignipirellula cremea]QDU94526.1 hypothetical protein Pla8534_23170 [Lignipirellula cremea]
MSTTIKRTFRTEKPKKIEPEVVGRIPRVAKLMALAIRFDGLIRDGVVADQAELARLGNVTRARVTQIMNLLNLAPEIQEAVLFLPRVKGGRDPVVERELRVLAAEVDWGRQRELMTLCLASPNRPPTARLYEKLTLQSSCHSPQEDCKVDLT